jgi:hypothetical protein
MNFFQHSYKFRNNVIRNDGICNGGINSMQRYCFFLNYANISTRKALRGALFLNNQNIGVL